MFKKNYILYLLIGIIFLVLNFRSAIDAWPYIFNEANVNKDYLAVDTVWYNPGNNYHNDILVNTLLSQKTCVYNEESWYADYYKVFSEDMDTDYNIPAMINNEKINKNDMVELGYGIAHVHSTLVNHKVLNAVEQNDVPKIFIQLDGMIEAERVVAINDEFGNIYLMTEEYWNEECKKNYKID